MNTLKTSRRRRESITPTIEGVSRPALNPRQRRFCELYATSAEFFCNGVRAYMQAYGSKAKPITYAAARTGASKLLANVSVTAYIDKLIENQGLNDQFVDKQLAMLITQNADLHLKLAAIREYNKIRGRGEDGFEDGFKNRMTIVLPGSAPHPRFTPRE